MIYAEYLFLFSFIIIGKELIACETAIKSFQQILNIVGGQSEKMRAEDFLKRISVYPDLTEDEEESIWQGRRLQIIGKIRDRTFKIITFGLFHKALTVTANKGALEAAKVQVFVYALVKLINLHN